MSSSKELYTLLKENYVYELFFTHVSLIHPKGKYSLSRSVLGKFWEYYCKLVVSEEEDCDLGIAESQQAYSAVLVDIDLKFQLSQEPIDDRLYTIKFVEQLVHIYQDVLTDVVDISNPKQLTCVLLEKPMYTVSDAENYTLYKNGFHLHFPYLFLSRINQEIVIVPRVRQKMMDNAYGILDEYSKFSKLVVGDKPITDLIDTAALKNVWLLYGSKKTVDQKPYAISFIYNHKQEHISLEDAFLDYKLYDEEEELIQLNQSNIKLHLPRIMSICPYGRKTQEIKASALEIAPLLHFIRKTSIPVGEDERTEEEVKVDLQTLTDVIKLLSSKRADERNDWMTVGWAIFNISKGSDEGLDIWINFSKQSPKFNEAQCIYEWSHMEDRKKITIGTLKYFAKQDNPEGYQKYLAESEKKHMKLDLKSTHYDLALILHNMFGDEFVYTESGWYQFTNHHWKCIENGFELRSKISKDLLAFFESIKKDIISQAEDFEKVVKTYQRIVQSLKMNSFKTSIMKECEEIFHVREFDRKLNTNKYLIGFVNGVYDLEKNIFRPGLPTDYISTQMPISYSEFTESDPRVKDVYHFLEKVFPDSLLRRYFLDVMCESFVGYNHRKQVYFWTGEGDNGKSITQMFFEKMFGKLSIKAPTSLITSKRPNAGSANAELARAGNGVRTIFLEEPDPDEEIFTGVFKHLSGNDSIYTRDLYQAGKNVSEIVPMFRLFVICNKLPKIRKGGDKATWNRIRVIPFESTFSKTAPVSIEEQLREKIFPVDPNLGQKIPSLVEPFAWILLQHRMKPKIDEPEKVVAATDRYRMNNDYIHQYLSQVIVDDEGGCVALSDLYVKYKDWLIEGLPGAKPPPLLDFTEYIIKKWGEPNADNVWMGKRIKFEQGKKPENAGDIL